MSETVKITNGRIAWRALSHDDSAFGASAFVGLVTIDAGFSPTEGVAYLMDWRAEPRVVREAVMPLNDDSYIHSVTTWLTTTDWKDTSVRGINMVRFLKAFPDDNAWVVFGCQRTLAPHFLMSMVKDDGDIWFDIKNGKCERIEMGQQFGMGSTIGQLLTEPVWPHEGKEYALPALTSHGREVTRRKNGLCAMYGAGKINQETLRELFINDRDLNHMYGCSIDDAYCKFIAKSVEMNPKTLDFYLTPMEKEEVKTREKNLEVLVNALIDEKMNPSPGFKP